LRPSKRAALLDLADETILLVEREIAAGVHHHLA